MHTRHRLALAMALLVAVGPAAAQPSTDLGQRLYRSGVGVDGRPVEAVVQGDVSVNGTQLACAGCHKRSGLGASEGGNRALPVTAPVLFGGPAALPANLMPRRPAYDDATLAVAMTSGRASDGRTLDPLMPRYRLSPADLAALTDYLRTLGARPAPGVGADEIELATIVSDSAPARTREAVTAVVQQFASYKNGVTRREQERADASRRHLYGERHARAFRRWHVSVWTLHGEPASWPAQLDELYASRPPFAVISGATGPDWPVVDAFCERRELPCVLPVTDLPRVGSGSFYNLYYSPGAILDARVTASSLAQDRSAGERGVLVVHADDALGHAAFAALRDAWPPSGHGRLQEVALPAGSQPSTRYWEDLLTRTHPASLVAWVDRAALTALTRSRTDLLPTAVYTAASFTDWSQLQAPVEFERRVVHVYPYSLPAAGLSQFPREQVWLKSQGLAGLETLPAAEALFACHAVGEAMLGLADNYSREYLMETLEHMLDGTSMTSLFPVTTLASGQRFLVKGAFVTRLASAGDGVRYVSGGWVQP